MSRPNIRRILIAYDVVKDKRRTRLAKTLEGYGDRIQFSVFVVDLTESQEIRLRDEVRDCINLREDSVLFCNLGHVDKLTDQQFSFLGVEREITPQDAIII